MISKRAAIAIAIIAVVAGFLAGHFTIRSASPPVASGAAAAQAEAATSASRAMTFTQPKAPAQ